MTSQWMSRGMAASVLPALVLGCLGPNPLADAGGDETAAFTETSVGDGDSTGDGDGDGDGDPSTGDGDGDGDGEPNSCSNGQLDGDETDIDCGGRCGPCDDGSACLDASDCSSQVCTDSSCQAATCEDQVRNADELEVDCGGLACRFCLHSSFVAELDDLELGDATHPSVVMFSDGGFALTHIAPTELEAHVRWFDPLAQPLGSSVAVDSTITPLDDRVIPMVTGSEPQAIHALVPGQDRMSTSPDLFLVHRTPTDSLAKIRINPPAQAVFEGDLSVEGSVATISWDAYDVVFTRRLDYDIGNGEWVDISPFAAETMPGTYSGSQPAMARNAAGISVVAWVRCSDGGQDCQVAVRRFDAGWLDPTPVIAPGVPVGHAFSDVRVAIADDGRVAVAFTIVGIGETSMMAWMLDAEFVSAGPAWTLQADIQSSTAGDVAALADGSFAYVWPDTDQDRVHLRRYVGANAPKLPDVGDESPWAIVDTPLNAAVAGIDGRLVVVWSAQVDAVAQIQGQVLSY